MPTRAFARRRPAATPLAVRLGLALAFPFVAALTVAGTYLGKEVIICAGWVALGMIGFLFVNPVMGISVMCSGFLLAAYPTLLQSLGALTINNLLGVGFVILLAAHILDTGDLSFLRVSQVRVLIVIGLLFLLSGYHATVLYPLLATSRGKALALDRTDQMSHDFIARLVFLVFFFVFVRTRKDIRVVFVTFMIALYIAVPSALVNWMQGTLNKGFRAAASLTSGANPNRLAMICLMEITCWWFWSLARPGKLRRLVAMGAIGAAMMVLLATGSRSGLLGCGVLLVLLQTGPRRYRVPTGQVMAGVLAGAVIVATIIPADDWSRMTSFLPGAHQVAASSNKMREDTIITGLHMVRDHPVLGVGLGNFREVSRQIYRDKFFRPPHNSYLWATSEGGLLVFAAYLLLFWITYRDLAVVTRLAHRDPDIGFIASAVRIVFLLHCFFALFADLWLNPITYILIGQIVTMRRYVESLPEAQRVVLTRPRLAAAVAAA